MKITNTQAICPRCAHSELKLIFSSPVAGAWDVLQCDRCNYMWRTIEPARNSSREAYPERFRMTEADVTSADYLPVIPPLKTQAQS